MQCLHLHFNWVVLEVKCNKRSPLHHLIFSFLILYFVEQHGIGISVTYKAYTKSKWMVGDRAYCRKKKDIKAKNLECIVRIQQNINSIGFFLLLSLFDCFFFVLSFALFRYFSSLFYRRMNTTNQSHSVYLFSFWPDDSREKKKYARDRKSNGDDVHTIIYIVLQWKSIKQEQTHHSKE